MARCGSACALVLLIALTACAAPGSGPAPEARTTLTGTYFGAPTLLPMAVSLVVIEPAAAPDAPAGTPPAGCTVQASSATVRVTPFEVASPIGANLVYGFTPTGLRLLALTPNVVNWADPGLDTFTLLAWVHADGPVAFTSTGTCSTASLDFAVDLELAPGWNRVGVRYDVLGGGRSARTVAIDDGALVVVGPFGP